MWRTVYDIFATVRNYFIFLSTFFTIFILFFIFFIGFDSVSSLTSLPSHTSLTHLFSPIVCMWIAGLIHYSEVEVPCSLTCLGRFVVRFPLDAQLGVLISHGVMLGNRSGRQVSFNCTHWTYSSHCRHRIGECRVCCLFFPQPKHIM